eukprot:TRINITY_DN9135_c0_g1_i2.p1 TRINITY_DN9135_c0_g1~~TRINITY_DN9135_c0_g1_i2.p1  ORF type:complete len:103 (-),score=16.38 TRINITY_DN9135_c0_g1_i2:23-331(-)
MEERSDEALILSLPKDVFSVIFSLITYSGSNWLYTRLVCKKWNELAEEFFYPDTCNALALMIEAGNLHAINKLIQNDRIDPSQNTNFAIRWASRYGYLDSRS